MKARCLDVPAFHSRPKVGLRSVARSLLLLLGLSAGLTGSSVHAQTLPVDPGELVGTQSSNGGPNPVVVLFDTRDPVGRGAPTAGPLGTDHWQMPSFSNLSGAAPHQWTVSNLGEVFGVALDDRPSPNIYVSATTLYEFDAVGIGGPGAIYKLDGVTGNVCVLGALPNGGSGLGNITFSPRHQSIFASNFDDGQIYRVRVLDDLGQPTCNSPSDVVAWDHGMQALPAGQQLPDDPASDMSQYGRLVFGVGYNAVERRLYYGVCHQSLESRNPAPVMIPNEVWSVALDSNGVGIVGSAVREFQTPDLFPFNASNPVSDITFKPTGEMLIAERSPEGRSAHVTRVLEYSGSSGNWVPSPVDKYLVGRLGNGTNSAGGVDSDCDGNVWATGDALCLETQIPVNVYGVQRTPAAGNTSDVPVTLNCYLIDFNQDWVSVDKTDIGSVRIRRQCSVFSGCLSIVSQSISCVVSGQPPQVVPNTYSYTFSVKNETATTIYSIKLGTPGTVSPNPIPIPTGLAPGAVTAPITVQLTTAPGDANPPGQVCVTMVLRDIDKVVVCEKTTCMPIPICSCGELRTQSVTCSPRGGYDFTFSVANGSGSTIDSITLLGAGVGGANGETIVLPSPLPSGGVSPPLTVWIPSVVGTGGPADSLCLGVLFNQAAGGIVCEFVHCLPIPPCECGQIQNLSVTCSTTRGLNLYDYTFTVTNNTSCAIYAVALSGAGVPAPLTIPLPTPLNPGQTSGPLTATVTETVTPSGPSGTICFRMNLLDASGTTCCTLRHCISDLPNCSCATVEDESLICVYEGSPLELVANTYSYTFSVTNTTSCTIHSLAVYSSDPNNPFDILLPNGPLLPGASTGPLTAIVTKDPSDGDPGNLCVRIRLFKVHRIPCCDLIRCMPIPNCACMRWGRTPTASCLLPDSGVVRIRFSVRNLDPQPMDGINITLLPIGINQTITPSAFSFPPVPQGGLSPVVTAYSSGSARVQLCMLITTTSQGNEICSRPWCVTLPPSCYTRTAVEIADVTGPGQGGAKDGVVTPDDLTMFLDAFAKQDASVADISDDSGYGFPDGKVSAGDVVAFINAYIKAADETVGKR